MYRLLVLCLALLTSFLTTLDAQVLPNGIVSDFEGNIYKTVTIGGQEWMAENLRTTCYNNGRSITLVSDSSIWPRLLNGAYCWYNNDNRFSRTYGAMYNWYTVETGKICPVGWSVPTDEEWNTLRKFIDSQNIIVDKSSDPYERGGKSGRHLKNSSGWRSGGKGENLYGFSALPGGERCREGRFSLAGSSGFWWSSTEYGASGAWFRSVVYSLDDLYRDVHPKWIGFSVRCIRGKAKSGE
jgi:uncharacterized protein (TIGR02145 family)